MVDSSHDVSVRGRSNWKGVDGVLTVYMEDIHSIGRAPNHDPRGVYPQIYINKNRNLCVSGLEAW